MSDDLEPVQVTEVGPRDGLQNENVVIPTSVKLAFIHGLVDAGFKQIEVTSFVREPFVRGHAHSGEGEEPVQGGIEQAIGELVTCSRCAGTWIAAGLAVTQVVAPRFGRLLTWSLGAAAANDFLQAGFTALTGKANELS